MALGRSQEKRCLAEVLFRQWTYALPISAVTAAGFVSVELRRTSVPTGELRQRCLPPRPSKNSFGTEPERVAAERAMVLRLAANDGEPDHGAIEAELRRIDEAVRDE